MTTNNVPDRPATTTVTEPNYRPFTDSILTDIAALPDDAQWDLFGELRVRHSPTLRIDWAALFLATVIPVAVLLGWHRLHAHLPDVWCGVIAGVAAMFAIDGWQMFLGSIGRVIRGWWLRRADRTRARR